MVLKKGHIREVYWYQSRGMPIEGSQVEGKGSQRLVLKSEEEGPGRKVF